MNKGQIASLIFIIAFCLGLYIGSNMHYEKETETIIIYQPAIIYEPDYFLDQKNISKAMCKGQYCNIIKIKKNKAE